MATKNENDVKRLGLPSATNVVAWLFGVFTLLLGAAWWMDGYLTGVVFFATGAFTLPNVRRGIREKWDVEFSRGLTLLLILVGWGIALALPP